MNEDRFNSEVLIALIEKTLDAVSNEGIQEAMSSADYTHIKTHTDAMRESVIDLRQRFPVASTLDPDDPETLSLVMGVLMHTSCIGEIIEQMRNSARRTAYKHSVRSIYRRRRCD